MTASGDAASNEASSDVKIPETWETFMTMIEDTICSIFVHTGIEPFLEGMLPAVVLQAEFRLGKVTRNGLPTQAEGSRLLALDDNLMTAVSIPGCHYLGRITANRYRRIYVMVRDEGDVPQIESSMIRIGEAHGYEVSVSTLRDEPLRPYRDLLFPTEQDWRWIHDQKALDKLREAGDLALELRPVDHYCSFPDMAKARSMQRWAREEGYRVRGIEHGEYTAILKLSHLCTMAPQDIGLHSMVLSEASKDHGGSYDGWDCVSVLRPGEGLEKAKEQGHPVPDAAESQRLH